MSLRSESLRMPLVAKGKNTPPKQKGGDQAQRIGKNISSIKELASFRRTDNQQQQVKLGNPAIQSAGAVLNHMFIDYSIHQSSNVASARQQLLGDLISACDWVERGITEEDTVEVAKVFSAAGCDLIDVSADQKLTYGRMFQVQFSEAIRNLTGLATIALGNIIDGGQVNTILHTRRADLVAIGRPHLWNPYFTRHEAARYGVTLDQGWEKQYLSGQAQAYLVQTKAREQQLELQRKAKPKRHATDWTDEFRHSE